MTSLPHLVSLVRSVRFFSLLLCFAVAGGAQHLTAQAISSAAPTRAGSSVAGVNASATANSTTSAATPHLRGTTMAQRKAAAANAAIRRSTAKFATRTGAHANAIVGTPTGAGTSPTNLLTADQIYFSSIYPNYANSPLPNPGDASCKSPNFCGIRKFVSALPGLPVATADTLTYPNEDYYEISLQQYTQQLHPDLPATTLRGYVQTNNGTNKTTGLNTVAPAPIQYLGPLIIATSSRPVRVKFTNNLPTGTAPGAINGSPTGNGNLFIPVDKSVMGSGLGFAKSIAGSPYLESRATIHMHGGNTPWISDGTPHQWTVPAGNFTDGSTLYTRGDSVQFVPDMYFVNGKVVPACGSMLATPSTGCSGGTVAQLPSGASNDPGNGSLTFYYTNQQSARMLFYHDHAYGTTRLNVYAGEAAGYLIQDQAEAQMIAGTDTLPTGVNLPIYARAGITATPVIPSVEIPLVIQDKTFVPQLSSTSIYSLPLLENGSGYTTATVGFDVNLTTKNCAVEPVATATVGTMPNFIGQLISGAVTGITITSAGSGCTAPPVVTITDPSLTGTGAVAYASMASLAQQDPTWDTQLWGGTGNFWYPHVYMTNQWPDNPDGSAVNPMGRWDYASWFWPVFTSQYQAQGEIPCPTTYNLLMVCPGTPSVLNPAPAQYLAGTPGGVQNFAGKGSIASLTPEAFMDTPLVNGEAYPTLAVEPKPYRFRILSVGNDRTLNLSWFYACDQTNTNYVKTASAVCPIPSATTSGIGGLTEVAMVPAAPTAGFPSWWPTDGRDGGVPDPLASGPSWIQIANEGGVLPAPVVIPPAPINYEYNRRSVTVTNTSSHSLNLMPAERADVIVDFTPYHGKTLILYNDAPAPYPAFDSRYDYYTGDPDQTGMGGAPTTLAGFGPNTRTVMQVTVGSTVATPSNITDTVNLVKNLNAVLPAVFYYTQPVPVLPASVYNNVYKGTFANILPKLADIQETFTPIGGTTPVTLPNRNKTIQELFELDFGRMNATLGTELALTNFNTQTTIPLNYVDPFTEDFYDSAPVAAQPVGSLGDGSQIWEVIHNGVDTHAIHFHLYNVQILDRVGWDGTVRYPDANEYGWKDTVRMNPLEIDFVAMRPMSQSLPFPVPDSTRLLDVTMPAGTTADPNMSAFGPQNTAVAATNGVHSLGWEYVWHCHILGHEENDMMRDQTFQVLPQAPVMGTVNGSLAGNTVTFTDKSLSETGFTLERADDAVFSVNKTDFTLPAQPGYNSLVTYLDATTASTPSKTFYYQVQSFKPDADFYAPGANLVSAWSGIGHTTLVPTASVNPTSLAFGNQRITTTSAAKTITLTNTGLATLTIGGISLTGTDASYFVLNPASTCVAPLASNASCTISVKFAPVSIGARSANVTITSNDPASPLNVPLTGNGQAAVIVTASSPSVILGSPAPTITATATGLVSPDTVASLIGMTCSTTYTPASAYGTTYPTTCQNAVNSNYQISYVAGKLTVIAIPPTMSPANGSVLAGSSQIFSWTNSNPTATSFNINVGTMGVGSSNVYFANGVSSPLTVNGLPTAGQTVYVRLSYYMRGVIQSVDLTYKAAGTPTPPALTTSPAPVGGVLPAGTSTTFTWTASNPAASTYGILVGTQGVGSGNIRVASGVSSPYTVNAMPTAGQTVYVRLNYTVAGVTLSVDYTFKAAGAATPPVLTAVGAVAGVLPSGTTATFTWTASNPVASTYGILVGTQGVGSGNIKVASGVSSPYTVNGLPATHGTTIYVRLNYTIIGVTQSVDYTFKTF